MFWGWNPLRRCACLITSSHRPQLLASLKMNWILNHNLLYNLKTSKTLWGSKRLPCFEVWTPLLRCACLITSSYRPQLLKRLNTNWPFNHYLLYNLKTSKTLWGSKRLPRFEIGTPCGFGCIWSPNPIDPNYQKKLKLKLNWSFFGFYEFQNLHIKLCTLQSISNFKVQM